MHYKGEEGTLGENGSGFSILVDLTKPSFEDLTLKMTIWHFVSEEYTDSFLPNVEGRGRGCEICSK